MDIGGDWYDVIPTGDEVALIVGDVEGHNVAAAAAMGQLRSAVRAFVTAGHEPSDVVASTNRLLLDLDPAPLASCCYVRFHPGTGVVRMVRAGHCPPLLRLPDGRAEILDLPGGPLLGVAGTADYPEAELRLVPGAVLALYTDGLVERRGESLDTGLDRLRAAAGRCATLPADRVCQALLRELSPPGGYRDDVAILALRPAGMTATSFVTVLPAAATELAPLRRHLGGWLAEQGIEPALCNNILITTGEAAVNAIEHGSRLDPTLNFSVEAFIDDTAVTVGVTDTGQWHADSAASRRSGKRGLGLTLMHGMADEVETTRSTRGTTVTLHFRRTPQPAGAQP